MVGSIKLSGEDLEKALQRAERAWAGDSDMTWKLLTTRFRNVPQYILRQRLEDKGLYPRRRMSQEEFSRRMKVPGAQWIWVSDPKERSLT